MKDPNTKKSDSKVTVNPEAQIIQIKKQGQHQSKPRLSFLSQKNLESSGMQAGSTNHSQYDKASGKFLSEDSVSQNKSIQSLSSIRCSNFNQNCVETYKPFNINQVNSIFDVGNQEQVFDKEIQQKIEEIQAKQEEKVFDNESPSSDTDTFYVGKTMAVYEQHEIANELATELDKAIEQIQILREKRISYKKQIKKYKIKLKQLEQNFKVLATAKKEYLQFINQKKKNQVKLVLALDMVKLQSQAQQKKYMSMLKEKMTYIKQVQDSKGKIAHDLMEVSKENKELIKHKQNSDQKVKIAQVKIKKLCQELHEQRNLNQLLIAEKGQSTKKQSQILQAIQRSNQILQAMPTGSQEEDIQFEFKRMKNQYQTIILGLRNQNRSLKEMEERNFHQKNQLRTQIENLEEQLIKKKNACVNFEALKTENKLLSKELEDTKIQLNQFFSQLKNIKQEQKKIQMEKSNIEEQKVKIQKLTNEWVDNFKRQNK